MNHDLPATLRVDVSFLAAGNIHFACPAVVLRLDEEQVSNRTTQFETALNTAQEHLARHAGQALELVTPQDLPALTFTGRIAQLSLEAQRNLGVFISVNPGFLEFQDKNSTAAFTCIDFATGSAALKLALKVLTGAPEADCDMSAKALVESARSWTVSLAKGAKSRGIPVSVAVPGDRPFLAIGHGKKRKLFYKNFTSSTGYLATTLSTRKDITARLLRDAGLPAPQNIIVRDASSAVRAADNFGYPVVVKPAAADFGRGVSTGICYAEQVPAAFARAAKYGQVLVEQQIPGDQHRLLVLHGRCIRVSRLRPARVTGDGRSTIAHLVEATNLTRPGLLRSGGMKIALDEAALELLAQQGLTVSSIPTAGKTVILAGNANLSSGGTTERVTNNTHPEVISLALKAASLLGIDVCGVDYISTDVTRSPAETGGAICEVNVTPGVVDFEEILDDFLQPFFPNGDNGRIPTICLITSHDNRNDLADGLAALLGADVARTDTVRFWGEKEPAFLPRRTAAVLADPLASAALISCSHHEISIRGLGLDRCSLAVLTPGIAKDAVIAVLRIATAVVMPAPIFAALADDPILEDLDRTVWLVGEAPLEATGGIAGFVRQADDGSIEVCPRFGAPWKISCAPASDDAITLTAAGVALGLPIEKIARSFQLIE